MFIGEIHGGNSSRSNGNRVFELDKLLVKLKNACCLVEVEVEELRRDFDVYIHHPRDCPKDSKRYKGMILLTNYLWTFINWLTYHRIPSLSYIKVADVFSRFLYLCIFLKYYINITFLQIKSHIHLLSLGIILCLKLTMVTYYSFLLLIIPYCSYLLSQQSWVHGMES